MKKFVLVLLLFVSVPALAQDSTGKIKVYLDCTQSWLCDFDYVRSELQVVNFVRDRFSADVHVLVNTQRNSSGGLQAQLLFKGQRKFQDHTDTLTYFNDPTSTADEQRKNMVQYLKLGLVPFVAKTSAAKNISVGFLGIPVADLKKELEKDRWNYWVFQFTASGSMSGNETYKSQNVYSNFSADRETDVWKVNIDFSYNYGMDVVKEEDGNSTFERRGYDANIQVAKSISQHWSYGLGTYFNNSLYSNIRQGLKVRPKLEYSVFKYPKFNSQRIVFQYLVGPAAYSYYDTTIYYKASEWQVQQSLNLLASFTKPWGSVNLGVYYSNYFDDFTKNNVSFNGAVSWKIIKGLNIAVWGNYGLIHDQINLRKEEASRDELLVRNKELKSSYRYGLGAGFSYRFGSLTNNFINPRFRGLNYSVNY